MGSRYLGYSSNRSSMVLVFLFLVLFSMGMSARGVFATTFIERPFPETVEDAPNIVRGVVGGSVVDWSGPVGDQRIYTFYDLQVSEILKGDITARTVVMREMGGEKDGVGMQVAGAARFERGDEVVVFLGQRNPDGTYPVRGMMMGRYDIVRDENDQEYLAGAGLSWGGGAHHHLDDHDEDMHHPTATASPRQRWTLNDLRELIREQRKEQEKNTAVSSDVSPQKTSPESGHLEPPEAPQSRSSGSEGFLAPEDADAGLPKRPKRAIALALGGLGALGLLIYLIRRGRVQPPL